MTPLTAPRSAFAGEVRNLIKEPSIFCAVASVLLVLPEMVPSNSWAALRITWSE